MITIQAVLITIRVFLHLDSPESRPWDKDLKSDSFFGWWSSEIQIKKWRNDHEDCEYMVERIEACLARKGSWPRGFPDSGFKVWFLVGVFFHSGAGIFLCSSFWADLLQSWAWPWTWEGPTVSCMKADTRLTLKRSPGILDVELEELGWIQKMSRSISFLHSVAPTCEGVEWIPEPGTELIYTLVPPAQQSVITAVPLPLRWPSRSHHPPLWSPHSLVPALERPLEVRSTQLSLSFRGPFSVWLWRNLQG